MRIPPERMSLNQRLAQPFILKGLMQGLSGRQILSSLRETGLGYRIQEFYRDLRYWRDAFEKSQRMRYTPRTARISEDRYVETWSRQRGGYQTVFRIDVFDRTMGQEKSFHITVVHEHPEAGQLVPDQEQVYTRAELEQAALQQFRYRVSAGEYEVRNIVPVFGWKVMSNLQRR